MQNHNTFRVAYRWAYNVLIDWPLIWKSHWFGNTVLPAIYDFYSILCIKRPFIIRLTCLKVSLIWKYSIPYIIRPFVVRQNCLMWLTSFNKSGPSGIRTTCIVENHTNMAQQLLISVMTSQLTYDIYDIIIDNVWIAIGLLNSWTTEWTILGLSQGYKGTQKYCS